jgi:hypothetical protein
MTPTNLLRIAAGALAGAPWARRARELLDNTMRMVARSPRGLHSRALGIVTERTIQRLEEDCPQEDRGAVKLRLRVTELLHQVAEASGESVTYQRQPAQVDLETERGRA